MSVTPSSAPITPDKKRKTLYAGGWLLALSISVGIAAGFGLFTLRYANGLSYLSSDPKACVNCHIMNRQYDGWTKASHHGVAACVDCHLPHTFFRKYYEKSENGYHHSEAFTTQNFAEPIAMRKKSRAILQENCVNCHADLTHEIASGPRGERDQLDCLHCHATVGHGERAALGGPLDYTSGLTTPNAPSAGD